MRKFTTEYIVYKFEELTPETKQKALDLYREKYQDSLYEDSAWSTQNDDAWMMNLEEYGLTYGGYEKTYFDTYRGQAGYGGIEVEDYKKLADALKLDKRFKVYKLIANENIHFNLNTGRDYNEIQDVEYEEYDLTYEELEALPEAVTDALQRVCAHIVDVIQELEGKLLKAAHDNEEYYFSDEGITESFEANEYEFFEDGRMA